MGDDNIIMTTYNIYYDNNGNIRSLSDSATLPGSFSNLNVLQNIDNTTYLNAMINGIQNYTIINGELTLKTQ